MNGRRHASVLAVCWMVLISGFVSAAQQQPREGGGASPSVPPTVYQTNFEDDWAKDAWTFSSNNMGPAWAIDATPDQFPGGIAESKPNSLNYNDSSGGYNTGLASNWGFAMSPSFNISNAKIKFRCNYNTRTSGIQADQRVVLVVSGDSKFGSTGVLAGKTLQEALLAGEGGDTSVTQACAKMGLWHDHSITVKLPPEVNSWKIIFNFYAAGFTPSLYSEPYKLSSGGWAIDDLMVTGLVDVSGPANGSDPTSDYTGPWKTVFSENFDGVEPAKDWDFSKKAPNLWAADKTPDGFPGGVAKSAPYSLNYNNGKDYDTIDNTWNHIPNRGSAKSPPISLTGHSHAILKFWCNYQTEMTGTVYDWRIVNVYSSDHKLIAQLATDTVAPSSFGITCDAMGTWHEHTITLNPAWGTIWIEFFFDTVDGVLNNFAGWAVDDVTVEVNAPTPTTPADSPADVAGSSQPSPSGGGGGGCGSIGVDLLLPLILLWLYRRRPRPARCG